MHNDYLTRASAWLKETQTSTAIVDAHNGLVRRVTAGKAKAEEVQDALDLLAEALIDQDGDPLLLDSLPAAAGPHSGACSNIDASALGEYSTAPVVHLTNEQKLLRFNELRATLGARK